MKKFTFDIAEPIAGTQWFHAEIEAETQEEANAKIVQLLEEKEPYQVGDYGDLEAEMRTDNCIIYDQKWNVIEN